MDVSNYMIGVAAASIFFYPVWVRHRRRNDNKIHSDITYAVFTVLWPVAVLWIAAGICVTHFRTKESP